MQMMDSMKRMIKGQGLEGESGEKGNQVALLEVTEEKEKCERVMTQGNNWTEKKPEGKRDSRTKFVRR